MKRHTTDDIRTAAAHILTRRQHHAWRLRTEGLPWHRIAQILGTTPRTARTHHHRANKRLHQHLTTQEPPWAADASAPTTNAKPSTKPKPHSSATPSKKPTPPPPSTATTPPSEETPDASEESPPSDAESPEPSPAPDPT